MIISINPDNPQPRLIAQAVDILKEGGCILYPTDTFYGIGCDIMNKKALEKVYHITKQDKDKPFSFICSDLKNVSDYAKVSNYAYKTMKRFLPGPYTFILEASKMVPKMMLTKRKTAGIRVPDNKICIELVTALGNPVISGSAIPVDDPDMPHEASLLHDYWGKLVDAVIEGGPVPGKPSSVVSLLDDEPEIIREGLGDVSSFI